MGGLAGHNSDKWGPLPTRAGVGSRWRLSCPSRTPHSSTLTSVSRTQRRRSQKPFMSPEGAFQPPGGRVFIREAPEAGEGRVGEGDSGSSEPQGRKGGGAGEAAGA